MAFGVAHNNRGSAAMREAIDRELAAKRPDMDYRLGLENGKDERDRLKATVQALETDLERAKSCIARLRATQTVEREEFRSRIEHLESRFRFAWDSAKRYKASWQKASAMIRACLSPEQVAEYRAQRDA